MADIFISYAQADRAQVAKLTAYLESEGWSVWYDKHLSSGDAYRDEIMKQLVAARAVLVLWTANAIKSDFVRAEAGRAKADGKLIPVKTADVEYRDIPLPFGEMHTENLANLPLIRAAVLAQLAKPTVQPSSLWLTSATLRYQALTWFGIIGGAITLFSNLNGVLNLADWARWLTSHWHDLTAGFWTWAFGWVGIRFSPALAPLLTLATFSVATVVWRAAVRGG